MTNNRTNIHATGVVLGRQGFLILGPSGSGKSLLARMLLSDAERRGMFAALISDDQVWIETHGNRLVAHRADTIKDMIEIRFSGIVQTASVPAAVIDAIITPVEAHDGTERLPRPDESMEFFSSISLPVLRLCTAFHPDITLVQLLLAEKRVH